MYFLIKFKYSLDIFNIIAILMISMQLSKFCRKQNIEFDLISSFKISWIIYQSFFNQKSTVKNFTRDRDLLLLLTLNSLKRRIRCVGSVLKLNKKEMNEKNSHEHLVYIWDGNQCPTI